MPVEFIVGKNQAPQAEACAAYFARYIYPTVLFPGEANHILPLGSLLSSLIPFPTAGAGYSVIFPVEGSRRPTVSIIPEAYQTWLVVSIPMGYGDGCSPGSCYSLKAPVS